MKSRAVLAITDFQLKRISGGGQYVVTILINSLRKYYKIKYVGQPNKYPKIKTYYPYKTATFGYTSDENSLLKKIIKSNTVRRVVRYAFHRFTFIQNRLLKEGVIDCDIVLSNSNYDDVILSADSKFHINYKGAIFVNHNPYYDFDKYYPDRLIKGKPFKIVALNSEDYRILSKRYGNENVVLIYNGVYRVPKKFSENYLHSLGITRGTKLLLSVGRLEDSAKKLSLAIKSIKSLLKDRQDIIYLIAGDGPSKDKYARLISKFKLKDKVRLLGFISDAEKTTLLRRADIFLQPSNKETFGIATVEALQAGAIVLTTKNKGSTDIIKDSKNGFFIKMTAKDISKKISEILRAPQENLDRLKKEAIKTSKKFSVDAMIQQYKNIINELIKRL